MASGGARNRSGPQKDPNSLRSSGLNLTTLPSEGYDGEAPDFPLADLTRREGEVWAWAWTTPQAAAWALEPWRWMTVAMWVRTFVTCEGPDATAADKGSLHRFADQIGMTPAGLKENGWMVARNELAAKREGQPAAPAPSARDRMKLAQSGDA